MIVPYWIDPENSSRQLIPACHPQFCKASKRFILNSVKSGSDVNRFNVSYLYREKMRNLLYRQGDVLTGLIMIFSKVWVWQTRPFNIGPDIY